jgi:hypothetical protein
MSLMEFVLKAMNLGVHPTKR